MSLKQSKPFNPKDINAVKHYKFVEFYYHFFDAVSIQMSELEPDNPTNRRLSTAPHTVSICKTVFIATNRLCVTTSEEMADDANHHEYIFRDFEKPTELKTIIDKFVRMLTPTKKYKFWIFNPIDSFEQVAPLTVLVSIWKNLQGREPEIGDADRLESVLFAVLDEFKINVDARKTVLTATLEGSNEHLHIRPKSGDEEKITRVASKWFFEECNLTANRTNLEMTPEMTSHSPDDLQIAQFEDCFQMVMDNQKIEDIVVEMGNLMKKFSDSRLESRSLNNENFVSDIHLDVAITNFKKADSCKPHVPGHEIKDNGSLCLYYCGKEKKFFGYPGTVSKYTVELLKQSKEAIEFATFELILRSDGAQYNPDWGRSTKMEKTVIKVKDQTPPPPPPPNPAVYPDVVTVDSDKPAEEEESGEPSAKRAREDHDNTYDDSDNSIA